MKPPFVARAVVALGIVSSALGAASMAHARGDFHVQIGDDPMPRRMHQPPVYGQPAPFYGPPRRVDAAPGYEYAPSHRGYAPLPSRDDGRYRRGPWGDHDGDGIANIHDRDSPRNRRLARFYGPYGDIDGDGILNQDDRDRDGDGVRNRHDRFPDDPYRR